ncbi:MAG TPA: HD domain-containing protein [Candidatus Paceibacterota bacterium]|nr:HD domain-containing protein [Candidatus Paceibacterota bacterium]
MRTAGDVYVKYKLPEMLQLHQLRVAAVGKIIADRVLGVNKRDIILTGLFHDMGNILKMDLSDTGPLVPFMEGESAYWRSVKAEFERTYGVNEHVASISIGREIGLSEAVLSMINNMRFTRTEWIYTTAPIEMKIAKYADLRVSPYGIVSMRDRLEEASVRYRGKSFDFGEKYNAEQRQRINAICVELEAYVCAKADIDPKDITDAIAAPVIEQLRDYRV